MNYQILISYLFIVMSAIAPWIFALGAVASTSTTPTVKTETVLNNNVSQQCVAKDGSKYPCP